ncbi:MAG: hypothetical protein H6936_09025 [Burkholderiales bacterium]|nr:hypothetical protein [Nitrosomonas sp.]MCP5274976.1 hypothetical protein [Burkholderiales bacterium]
MPGTGPISQISQAPSGLLALDEIALFYQHLEKVLIQIDFLNPRQPKKLMQRIRRLFSRARLEINQRQNNIVVLMISVVN